MKLAAIIMPFALSVAATLPVSQQAHAQQFSCAGKKTCGRMSSCTEAVFRLRQCGDERRDGDNDGIPCEAICGKTKSAMQRRLSEGR